MNFAQISCSSLWLRSLITVTIDVIITIHVIVALLCYISLFSGCWHIYDYLVGQLANIIVISIVMIITILTIINAIKSWKVKTFDLAGPSRTPHPLPRTWLKALIKMPSEIFHCLNTNILSKQADSETLTGPTKILPPLQKKILSRAHLNKVSRMVAHIKILLVILVKIFLSPCKHQ